MEVSAEVFVVMKPFSKDLILGRNAVKGEAQEVVYFPGASNDGPQKLTNIEIEGAPSSAVILSKPIGVWGAESGANDKKLTVALTYTCNETDGGLLGIDLVRLALERASSTEEAVTLVGELVEKHGSDTQVVCLVLCDTSSAWILNGVGNSWAAEQLTESRSIGPGISIGSTIDKSSEGFKEKLEALGHDVVSKENWYDKKPAEEDSFSVTSMFDLLRSTENCSSSQSSHVSVLSTTSICCNWFTATPNPAESVFKPFVFTFGSRISPLTKAAEPGVETTLLHKLHATRNWETIGKLLQSLEAECVEEVNKFLNEHPGTPNQELDDLMKDCVEAEVKFYR